MFRTVARRLALLLCAGAVAAVMAAPAGALVVITNDGPQAPPPEGLGALLTEALGVGARGVPERTVLYEVGVMGKVRSDPQTFRRTVTDTLRDARGWGDAGRILFLPVRRDGEVRIWLAAPSVVADAHPTCSSRYSCRVEDDVYINDRRWRGGATSYADRPLSEYRQYVINHELGHWLGLGHRDCPAREAAAWVMQQQTITLDGCESRVWPQEQEIDEARRNVVAQSRQSRTTRSPVPPADGAAMRSSRPGSGTR